MNKDIKNSYFTVNIKNLEHYLFGMTKEERDKDFDEWWENRGREYYQELKDEDAKNNIFDAKDMKIINDKYD